MQNAASRKHRPPAESSSSGEQMPKTSGTKPASSIQRQINVKKKKKKAPHPLEALLGDVVIDATGNSLRPEELWVKNGILGLYFAAHWCPPCRSFCPTLVLLYEELKKRDEPFEVIFVSMDNKKDSFLEYLAKMPWFALPFDDEEKREEIAVNFGVQGIPVVVLLDIQSLEVIAYNGREIVSRDPKGALYPWKQLPVNFAPPPSSRSSSSNSGSSNRDQQGPTRSSFSSDKSEGSRRKYRPESSN